MKMRKFEFSEHQKYNNNQAAFWYILWPATIYDHVWGVSVDWCMKWVCGAVSSPREIILMIECMTWQLDILATDDATIKQFNRQAALIEHLVSDWGAQWLKWTKFYHGGMMVEDPHWQAKRQRLAKEVISSKNDFSHVSISKNLQQMRSRLSTQSYVCFSFDIIWEKIDKVWEIS